MTEPTPGPWHLLESGFGLTVWAGTEQEPKIIADSGHHDPEMRANYQLIAAAREALDACRELVREHENLEDRAPVEPDCGTCNLGTGPHKRHCAYHAAKHAIAQAEGRL